MGTGVYRIVPEFYLVAGVNKWDFEGRFWFEIGKPAILFLIVFEVTKKVIILVRMYF